MSRRDLTTFRDWCEQQTQDQQIPPAERALWRALAEEIRTYLEPPAEAVDLFGQATSEPIHEPAHDDREEQPDGT